MKTRTRLFLKTNVLLNNFWNRIFQDDLTVKATRNSINFMKGLCVGSERLVFRRKWGHTVKSEKRDLERERLKWIKLGISLSMNVITIEQTENVFEIFLLYTFYSVLQKGSNEFSPKWSERKKSSSMNYQIKITQ